jgi:mannose-6-phosphate isomerase
VYQSLVWGGRRLAGLRDDVPAGPIGEAWDIADHARGMSVVADGALAGTTLADLVASDGRALVGDGFVGNRFPIMVKVLDAADRLSVQVHPDDVLARKLGVGDTGKTECWLLIDDGGELFAGTRAGVDRAGFERALAEKRIVDVLEHFEPVTGDFFFIEARTVHALGRGCLLFEVQQTCDVTFRMHDWDRLGLDGKPRPLQLAESLATIDFSRTGSGPRRPPWQPQSRGVDSRSLASCAYFTVDERRIAPGATSEGDGRDVCTVVSCESGEATLATAGGAVTLRPTRSALVPAAAGPWRLQAVTAPTRVMISQPRFG